MNRAYVSILALSLTAFAATQAVAADPAAAKTREQVQAELAAAVRNGDLVQGPNGLTLNAAPVAATLSREQVRAELADAVKAGNIVLGGESALKANELQPSRYPQQAAEPGKTREQVNAELREAIRTHQLPRFGDA